MNKCDHLIVELKVERIGIRCRSVCRHGCDNASVIKFLFRNHAALIKRDLSGMGKWLTVGAVVLLVAGIINVFVGSTAGMLALSVLAILIFSGFMLFDLKRIVDGGETNYISATLSLYLSIYNVFQSLLMLLGIGGGSND